MREIKLTDDIFYLGVNDRRTSLFENFWPLPCGVSYNSYLVVDEKTCLIDTVDRKFIDDFYGNIDSVLGDRPIDYLIVNHVEPDHSGSIKAILGCYPDIVVVGNKKTFPLIENFYGPIPNKMIMSDGEELCLGKHTFVFYTIPMVHWPESMVSYEKSLQILFSNDAFGSFGSLDGGIFDDEIDLAYREEEIMRYFTNIVGKYCPHTQRALQKLAGLNISQIAPSHGLIWRSNLSWILERYQKWSSYTTEKGVVIVFGSMYGNTEKMADLLARELVECGIKNIRIYDASKTHISYIISDIFKFKGVALGSCAYNNEMFPSVEALVHEIEHKGIKNHCLGIFGSFSWNGGGVKNLQKFADEIGWEVIAPAVEQKGSLDKDKIMELKCLAKEMADRLL